MADLSTVTLPVLPLRNGVVFPHMVVTVTIESDEARRAIAAAESTGGKLLLVPQLDGEYANIGTIADIQEVSADDPAAPATALIAGVSRARIGSGQPTSNDVLMVEAEPVADNEEHSEEVTALANEFRAVVREILQHRGIGAISRVLDVDDPGQLADLAVYLSLIHISEPTRLDLASRMPSSA